MSCHLCVLQLAEKQYFLTALAARSKLKVWTDVDSLFTTRNWLGFTKKKSPVAFQRVLDILHKNNAPVQVITTTHLSTRYQQHTFPNKEDFRALPLCVVVILQSGAMVLAPKSARDGF